MLRIVVWAELLISILALAVVVWPVSGFCRGRLFGFDCESWLIFGVNIFAPVGLFGLICSIWFLNTRSLVSQYILLSGCMVILAWWFLHTL